MKNNISLVLWKHNVNLSFKAFDPYVQIIMSANVY